MKLLVEVSADRAGRHRAWCPALPGCHAFGQSRQDAVDKLNDAIGAYLASLNVAVPQQVKMVVRPN